MAVARRWTAKYVKPSNSTEAHTNWAANEVSAVIDHLPTPDVAARELVDDLERKR